MTQLASPHGADKVPSVPRCALDDCAEEAWFTITLTPNVLPPRPLGDDYLGWLRKFTRVHVRRDRDGSLHAAIPTCYGHADELVSIWIGWLMGTFDPEVDDPDIVWAEEAS